MTSLSTRTKWLIVFVLICCSGTAQAQDELKLRMSLSYQGATAASVFEALSSVLGYRLRLDSRVTGSVTLDVRNITAETVLRAVCESVGCRWRIDKRELVIDYDADASAKAQADSRAQIRLKDVHKDIPAQIVWNRVPFDAAAKTIAQMLAAELRMDVALSAKHISLNQNRDTAWTALNALCQQAGCRWRMVNDPKRVLLIVAVSTAQFVSDFAPGLARLREPGVTAPKVISAVRPRYPEAAKQAKVEGLVEVECVVRPDGTVGDVNLVRSLDKIHGLDDEAVMATRLYLFEPGTKDGKPVPVVARLTFTFTIR